MGDVAERPSNRGASNENRTAVFDVCAYDTEDPVATNIEHRPTKTPVRFDV